jgi:DNA-3-methyladenine glycosylase II
MTRSSLLLIAPDWPWCSRVCGISGIEGQVFGRLPRVILPGGDKADNGIMQSYLSRHDLDTAIASLCAVEPRFMAVHERHGTPSLRVAQDGLEGLLMIVTEQFLSLQAAAAIWRRVFAAVQPFTVGTILAQPDEVLKSLGLSNAKVRTFKAVAICNLNFDVLARSPDAEVHRTLCALPGIGPWTTDIYLLSCLQRCDAWPVGDLALQLAAQDLLGLAGRPTPKDMLALAEPWRPHRAAAARLLWSHYRGLKGVKQA